jgi:hypothetical protein
MVMFEEKGVKFTVLALGYQARWWCWACSCHIHGENTVELQVQGVKFKLQGFCTVNMVAQYVQHVMFKRCDRVLVWPCVRALFIQIPGALVVLGMLLPYSR